MLHFGGSSRKCAAWVYFFPLKKSLAVTSLLNSTIISSVADQQQWCPDYQRTRRERAKFSSDEQFGKCLYSDQCREPNRQSREAAVLELKGVTGPESSKTSSLS
ncbi:uncharacterized protein LOC133502991 isoform X2 [Syngnathoides biaculeatus]|uniref:uncharacterized protein LOC133502991 isoform X2 n=1 Tax=Syngnathoides biaculeatus TaxID=300417 RepID=UPI002ADE0564|nr:uncharacterized protein LOC133502991 isoform X2 [Syngnathoides biaculeatus]